MVGNPVNQEFYNKLAAIIHKNEIKTNELLSCHTTFRIGGPADYYVTAGNKEEAAAVLGLCRTEGMPCFLIGNGSNLLVSDKGYRGVVLKLSEEMYPPRFQISDGLLHAKVGAGGLLAPFAKEAARLGASGFEFAAGIPGSIGGAIFMNAGAYGGEIGDSLKSVLLLGKDGKIARILTGGLELAYRSSILQFQEAYILEAEFVFQMGRPESALKKIAHYAQLRKERQPLEYPSAGSTFKRPKGHFAGKLIMEAGLAGMRIGGAKVSEKHCGFIINTGNANACDVMRLIAQVQRAVQEKSGILLELEVRMLGEF